MSRSFHELRKGMPAERVASAERRARVLLAEMALRDLRQSLQISQEELAEELGITQASLSKLERRADMFVSSVRKIIEGLGGQLVIVARFPDGDVRLKQFADLHEREGETSGPGEASGG